MTLQVELESHVRSARDADLPREANSCDSPIAWPPRTIVLTMLVAAAALFAVLSGPALCGLVYTADDLGAFHLPLRAFYARALAAGDAFDWCPHLYGGFYLTGEGQAGTYHPLHWLVYRSLPLGLAWNIECLASYPVLFIGTWLFLRRRGLEQASALFGASVFTFCGFNLLHFVHVNAIAVVAHVPWLLYALDDLRAAHRQRNLAGKLREMALIAALTGSQLLLGYPQYVIYSLVAEALYLLFPATSEAWEPASRRPLRFITLWSLAKLLGLALGAVQVLPTLEALADSVRQNVDASFSASGSLHPLNAVQLVAPYLFATRVVGQNTHELGLYAGAATLMLAIVAIANRRALDASPHAKALMRFAVALVVLGGLIALGGYGPVQPLLALLPFGYLRFPCRAIVLVHLGMGLLAALGFRALTDHCCRTLALPAENGVNIIQLPRKTIAFTILVSFALAIGGPLAWPEHTATAALVWCGPGLISIAALLILRAARGSRLAINSLVFLSAIDLGCYGLSYAVYRDVARLHDYIAETPAPPQAERARVALDLAASSRPGIRSGNQILLSGLSRIDGYVGLEPARALDYRDLKALRLAGVRFIAAAAPVEHASLERDNNGDWFELLDPLPRARLVQAFRSTDTPRQSLDGGIDLVNEAMIQPRDREVVALHLGETTAQSAAIGAANISIDCPGHIVVKTDTPRPAILLLNESFHRGWAAAADGVPLETLRLNGDFLGCLVKSGRATSEFRFAPDSLAIGRLVSVCGLGLLVMLLAASRPGTPPRRVA